MLPSRNPSYSPTAFPTFELRKDSYKVSASAVAILGVGCLVAGPLAALVLYQRAARGQRIAGGLFGGGDGWSSNGGWAVEGGDYESRASLAMDRSSRRDLDDARLETEMRSGRGIFQAALDNPVREFGDIDPFV
jgi:hypothetical protein